MPRACIVCQHADRVQIDVSLQNGIESLQKVANRYGISKHAMARHKINHLEPSTAQQAALGAIQQGQTVAMALPTEYMPQPGQINAYQDMIFLRDKAVSLLTRLENQTGPDGEGMVSTYELTLAMKELRETTKTLVHVYETQKRIEAEYTPPEKIEAGAVFSWLKKNYPGVLLELVKAIKAGQ